YANRYEIDIDIDNNFDTIQTTYSRLVHYSPKTSLLSFYDILSLFVSTTPPQFPRLFQIACSSQLFLALTTTMDLIFYAYYAHDKTAILIEQVSTDDEKSVVIHKIPNMDSSRDETEFYQLCSLDDGTIYFSQNCQLFSSSGVNDPLAILPCSIIKMSASKEHVLLLLSNGDVYSLGLGLHGALGHGDLEQQTKPVKIERLQHVIDIACGGWHSLAVLNDHSTFTWGWNCDGQLGIISDENDDNDDVKGVYVEPTLLDLDCDSVYAGSRHSVFLSNGELYSCGLNKYGQLGFDDDSSFEPKQIVLDNNKMISCVYCSTWTTLITCLE
ncbi:unnamed protein product, partial [Didymodactylos carnosus]